MSRDVAITPGTGDAVSFDGNVQRVKVAWGTDGTQTDASAANPIPVVQTGTPALPTGAATEATLAAVSGKLITGGPQLGSGVITATVQRVSLCTDGPEVTNSTAIKNSTASLDTKAPAQGQATMAASTPVVIASNQSAIPVSNASLPLPTGAATSALQTTGNASLATIATNTLAAGQGTKAASSPVVIASDDDIQAKLGIVTEAAPASDTASSGLNGRLQRIAQRVTSMIALFPSALGRLAASASLSVVQATDVQPTYMPGVPVVIGTPSAQSIAATGTIQFSVSGGTTIALTLTNAPAATATWVATVGFQWSADGSAWNSLTCAPKTSLPGAGNVTATSATAVGLWLAVLPANAAFVRYNVTAWTSGTIWGHLEAWGIAGNTVILPFTPSVTSGATLCLIETSGICEATFHFTASTTTVLTFQGSNDPTFAAVITLPVQSAVSITSGSAAPTTVSAASLVTAFRVQTNGFKWIRAQVTTTGTVLTIQGFSATMGSKLMLTSAGTSVMANCNLNTIAGGSAIANLACGGAAAAQTLGVYVAGPTVNTDYSAQAWAAASGSGATIAVDVGSAMSFDVNLSVFTAGSSTGLDIFLQWSPDSGTTWYDIWQCETLTAVGHVFIPPMAIPGRRRMRWVNNGGAATTATVTVIANGTGLAPVPVRQWYDRTANVLNGTLSTATAAYDVNGCKTLTAFVTLGTAVTAAFYQFQISTGDGRWGNVGTATQAVASSTTSFSVSGVTARFARLIVTTGGTTQVGTIVAITGCN